MVEPLSWAVLGALVATEGIKFLYGQATEVLKRRRERKAGKEAEAAEPIAVPADAPLQGRLEPPQVDFDVADRLQDEIKALRSALADYADGLADPEPGDQELAAAANGLREALEVVYGQRITFQGEDREPSGRWSSTGSRRKMSRVRSPVSGHGWSAAAASRRPSRSKRSSRAARSSAETSTQ